MVMIDLVKPWRIMLGLLPIVYGTLVILELERSWLWLLLASTMIVLAVVAANTLDYTLLAAWPPSQESFVWWHAWAPCCNRCPTMASSR